MIVPGGFQQLRSTTCSASSICCRPAVTSDREEGTIRVAVVVLLLGNDPADQRAPSSRGVPTPLWPASLVRWWSRRPARLGPSRPRAPYTWPHMAHTDHVPSHTHTTDHPSPALSPKSLAPGSCEPCEPCEGCECCEGCEGSGTAYPCLVLTRCPSFTSRDASRRTVASFRLSNWARAVAISCGELARWGNAAPARLRRRP